jgi:hypothetical protein
MSSLALRSVTSLHMPVKPDDLRPGSGRRPYRYIGKYCSALVSRLASVRTFVLLICGSASAWGHIPVSLLNTHVKLYLIPLQVVQLLIERGCAFNAKNNEGFTASDYAYSYASS